jgi:uncharacterized protein
MEEKKFAEITSDVVRYNLMNLKQLVFEVTDACNLKCRYCGYSDLYEGYDARENKYLMFEKAKALIDYLVNLWKECTCTSFIQPLTVSFYGGEPLMNVALIKEIISYLETIRINKKYTYAMTTNAMLLDKYMDYLVDKQFRLLISLDGDEQGHSYRVDHSGKNSFGRVIRNVKLLQSKYPDYFCQFVHFNSVLHNRNSVDQIFHFIKEKFSKEPSISGLCDSGIRKDKVEEFWNTYQNIESSIKKAPNCEAFETELFIKNPKTASLLSYIHKQTGNVYNNYIDLYVDKNKFARFPTGTCIPFLRKLFVTVNGKLLNCERIDHKFVMGFVSDNEIELDFEKIAVQHNDYVSRYRRQCRVCAIRKGCSQCVYQIDDIDVPDSKCLKFRNAQIQKQKDEFVLDYLRKHPELYSRIMKEERVV